MNDGYGCSNDGDSDGDDEVLWGDEGGDDQPMDASDTDGGWGAVVEELDLTEDGVPVDEAARREGCPRPDKVASDSGAAERVARHEAELARAWWGGVGPVVGEWRLPESYGAWRNPHCGVEHAVAAARAEDFDEKAAVVTRFVVEVPFWIAATRLPPFDRAQPAGHGGPLAGHASVWRLSNLSSHDGAAYDAKAKGDDTKETGDAGVLHAALQPVDSSTRAWWARGESALVERSATQHMEGYRRLAQHERTPEHEWKLKAEREVGSRRAHQVSLLHRLARTTAYLGGACVSPTDDALDRAQGGLVAGFAYSALTPLQCLAARGDPEPLAALQYSGAAVSGNFAAATRHRADRRGRPHAEATADVLAHLYSTRGAITHVGADDLVIEGFAEACNLRLRFDRVAESPMAIAVAANHLAFVEHALTLFGGPFFQFAPLPSGRPGGGPNAPPLQYGAAVPPEAYEVLVGAGERGHLAMFQLLHAAYTALGGDAARVAADARVRCGPTLALAWGHLAREAMPCLPFDVARCVLEILFPAIVCPALPPSVA